MENPGAEVEAEAPAGARARARSAARAEARRQRRRRARRLTVTITATVLLAAGGYTAAAANAPLPQLEAHLAAEATTSFEVDPALASAAVTEQALPTAIAWQGSDTIWVNDEAPQRIASLTKLVTVLVGLEAAPLEVGEAGPQYTLSDTDAQYHDAQLALFGTVAPVPVGTALSTHEILQLILLPSANNYADTYARWVFGSEEAYVAAANDWIARQGLTLQIVDPSGVSDANLGTATDIVRLAKLALENPVIAGIVAQSSAEITGIGTITSSNRLLADDGVTGVKTGTTFPDGYSLSVAKRSVSPEDGRQLTLYAVTLSRPDADTRDADARAVLAAGEAAVQRLQLVEEGEVIGTATTWNGEELQLVAQGDISATLLPGESAQRSDELGRLRAGPAGSPVGTVRVSGPEGETEVEIVTSAAVDEPGLWWRLAHPENIFG